MKAILIFALCSFLALPGFAQTSGANKTPMTNSEFNRLLQGARDKGLESISSDYKDSQFTDMFASNSSFSTAQVRNLLSRVAKDSGKLALARFLYGRVTDPHNFAQLANLFKSETYRNEFVLWVNEPDKQPYHDSDLVSYLTLR
jgi:hypothetical protein